MKTVLIIQSPLNKSIEDLQRQREYLNHLIKEKGYKSADDYYYATSYELEYMIDDLAGLIEYLNNFISTYGIVSFLFARGWEEDLRCRALHELLSSYKSEILYNIS